MKDNFVNLHTHCEFSLLDGYGHPEQYAKRAKELGQSAIAITDHGNISGHFRWYNACLAEGIKPILGCEFYIVDDVEDMMSKKVREYNHITILASNLEGYRNLLKLVSFSYEEGFYYKPKIDWKILARHSKGLIATSSCPSGKIANMVKHNIAYSEIVKEVQRQTAVFEPGCFFIELAPWNYAEGKEIAKGIYTLARDQELPMILTMDCHYPLKEHAEIQEVMLCVQMNDRMNNPKRWKFDQNDFYLKSGQQMKEDWEKLYPNLPFRQEMIDNTQKIADMIDFKFPLAKPVEFPFVGDKKVLLKAMAKKGLQEKGFDKNQIYIDRMETEYELILKKNYVDYFLVISDLINWAKKKGIFVGPGRGSAAGSLICYLVGITEIDPIPFGLLFERFIDINRDDLPDVDIDIEDERRGEVKEYLKAKYGQTHVASLATFGTFRGRMCLQDVGRVFSIDPASTAEVKKLVVQRSGGDSRFGFTVEDTFNNFDSAGEILKKYPEFRFAKELEGHVRHMGIHAAGTIVSNEPIENFAAFYKSEAKNEKVISMDYHDASAIGLLKIDLLGLTTMSILKEAIDLIWKRHQKKIDLYKLPLDDKATIDSFKAGKLFGIFQFDGQAMMQVCKQVKPDNFGELADINALSRPGPLHSGGTTSYIQRKFGKEEIVYLHPIIKDIAKDTYGVILYQEQVMQVVRQIGKFSWEDTSTIRRTMSRSSGAEAFDRYQEQFVKGAGENGLSPELALEIWRNVYTFGSWAFNKSHSVSYSLIGYWMMYLKVHYPLEFYVSMVMKEKQEDRVKKVLKEYQNEGYKLLPVDVNKSKANFSIENEGIRIGFMQVAGIGEKTAEKAARYQPYHGNADFLNKTKSTKASNLLLQVGAFREVGVGVVKQQTLFAPSVKEQELVAEYMNPSIETLAKLCPIMITETPYANWIGWCEKNTSAQVIPIKDIGLIEERTDVCILGSTNPGSLFNPKNKLEEARSRGFDVSEMTEPSGTYDFLNFDIEDESDYVAVRIPYRIYKKYKEMIWAVKPSDVLLVSGMVNGGIRMVFANNIVNLTDLKRKIANKIRLTPEENKIINFSSKKGKENQWL